MASAKDTFESKSFASNTFAAGTFRGVGAAGEIAGTCTFSFGSGSSTLTGSGALAGSAAIALGAGSSTLTGTGALAGSAAITFTLAGSTAGGESQIAGTCAITFMRSRAADLTDYWPLNESSGNALDVHGSNDLTDVFTVGASATGIGGQRDLEADNGECFTHVSNADLQTGDISFSFSVWATPESFTDFQVVAGKGDSEWYMNFGSGLDAAKPRFVIRNATVAQWGSDLVASTRYFFAGGYNATSNEVWFSLNAGTPVTATDATGPTADATQFAIGAYPPTNGLNFDGLLDEAAFFKRDIRSDLAELYNAGSGRDYRFITGESTLTASGALAGTAAMTFGSGSSTLTGAGALAGSSALTFTTSLANAGVINIAGTCDLTFGSGSSTLAGSGALAGTASLLFGAGSSTLIGAGALNGSAVCTFGSGSSTLTAAGVLAGSSALTFTVSLLVGEVKYPTGGIFARSETDGIFYRSETIGIFERQS